MKTATLNNRIRKHSANGKPHANGKPAAPPLPPFGNGEIPAPAPAAKPAVRDQASGRFAAGNTFATGHVNPTARARAQLQKALVNAVTSADLDRLAKKLLSDAMNGSVPSAELLLRYAIGKPRPSSDPDRVVMEAWEFVREWPLVADLFAVLTRTVSPDLAGLLAHGGAICEPEKLQKELGDAQEELELGERSPLMTLVARIMDRRIEKGK